MMVSFKGFLQLVQNAEPRAFELAHPPFVDFVQGHRIEKMQLLAAAPAGADQVGRFQQAQMLGGRLARHIQVLAQLAQGLPVFLIQEVKQLSAARVAERLEYFVRVHDVAWGVGPLYAGKCLHVKAFLSPCARTAALKGDALARPARRTTPPAPADQAAPGPPSATRARSRPAGPAAAGRGATSSPACAAGDAAPTRQQPARGARQRPGTADRQQRQVPPPRTPGNRTRAYPRPSPCSTAPAPAPALLRISQPAISISAPHSRKPPSHSQRWPTSTSS